MTGEIFVDGVDRLHSDILRIFSRLLESPDLSLDDDFFDRGGDSLLATELMLELRKMTGKELPDSLLFESSTVRSLAQRLSEKEAPQRKVAVRVGAASEGAKPLIFFHGDWTRGGFYVEHLARKLGPEISLIAVAPHGPGGEPIPPSIEEMAADRLPAVLEAQPNGPYRLAGHCVGGIVALETARLLMRLNHRVETVVMIDSPLMTGGEVSRAQAAHGSGNAGAADAAAASDDTPIRPATPAVDWGFEFYEKRLAAYSPTPLEAPLRVLAAEYDGRGWARLSGEAELVEIPGDHFDLVTLRINDLASNLRSWLSGEAPPRSGERNRLGPATKDQISSAGSSNRESRQSPGREDEDKALATGESDKKIPASRLDQAKQESLSRRLGRFFNYARG
jgi:oxalate---CoA ligase